MRKTIAVVVLLGLAISGFFYFQDSKNSLITTGKLSKRSEDQMWKAIRLPHVVGGYIVKRSFSKEESPLIWVGSYHPGVIKVASDYVRSGGGTGIGSEFFKNNDKDSPIIVNAVHQGQITCDKIENASVSKMVPGLLAYVKSMCFMPLPAFDLAFQQIIVFLFDVPLEEQDDNIRKELLKVQLDIHTREYTREDVSLIK